MAGRHQTKQDQMEGRKILRRSSIFGLLLIAAALFVGLRIYSLWQEDLWEMPRIGKGKGFSDTRDVIVTHPGPLIAGTQNIINKSLFDPGRGASRIEDMEVADTSFQLAGNMSLIGTFITENERYAIIQLPPSPGRAKEQERFKVNDMVEEFRLSEIHEKKVVLKRGSSKIELMLDFFLKTEEAGQRPGNPATVVPETKSNVQQKSDTPAGTEKFLSNFGRFQNRGSAQVGNPLSEEGDKKR